MSGVIDVMTVVFEFYCTRCGRAFKANRTTSECGACAYATRTHEVVEFGRTPLIKVVGATP